MEENKRKFNMSKTKLMLGDNIASLKKLPDNSVDSIVTDPPYGLSFMNKKWDYDVPSVELWKEALRVLKPGGHILSFGGTRTYHRMVVNIEDAGFEIRDQIMWLYGSGFPKSHNIGKAVDKIQGNEREVIGERDLLGPAIHEGGTRPEGKSTIELTKGQSEYEGWGTALKPAQEIVAVAQKPENLEGTALNLIYTIKKELWKLYVKIVEISSELNQAEQKEALDTALCLVEKNTNIQDALQGVMDMSQLKLMENMNWSIVLLWHNILEDLYQKMSRYTTSTKSNLIIDLKTLKSLEWQNILENITQVKDNQTDGLSVNALTAVVLFNALNLKLKDIHQHSVEDNVIYKEDKMDCANEPICVARKPLSEKTIALNALKWGTGGINIDGSRVGTNEVENTFNEGRFPANIILECICDEVIKGEKGEVIEHNGTGGIWNEGSKEPVGRTYNDKGDTHTNPMCPCRLLDEQSGVTKSTKAPMKSAQSGNNEGRYNWNNGDKNDFVSVRGHNDKGGASRYFYQAKVSKKERNMGLDHFEEKETKVMKNAHPTVKPVALMAYLCRLVTPQGGIVLDPFMGSGSTGIAAQLEGFKFCGMEMSEDYFKISEARIENYEQYREFIK